MFTSVTSLSDNFFPDNLDFTAFFQDCEVGIPGDSYARSLGTAAFTEGKELTGNDGDELIKVPLPIRMPHIQISSNKASGIKTEAIHSADDGGGGGKEEEGGLDVVKRSGDKRYRVNVDIRDMTMKQKLERRLVLLS